MQILGVFAPRGNVKAAALPKIVLEATFLCEQAGLFVDGSSASIKCKCLHPADERRFLHFFSDFPHLMKNVRNGFLETAYTIHRRVTCMLAS
ncbi:hypothetical protein HPB48_014628 [Haemaphysalis longicornis]|uniref:Uncharacterized protein n=1 Tax=Haemaphysalis longicornis TaxID=44386 RepID=A0A9J6FBE5_HAELO|nr:hypothetical protein HPB48_014628 [Haemaphysalis longicornis]